MTKLEKIHMLGIGWIVSYRTILSDLFSDHISGVHISARGPMQDGRLRRGTNRTLKHGCRFRVRALIEVGFSLSEAAGGVQAVLRRSEKGRDFAVRGECDLN